MNQQAALLLRKAYTAIRMNDLNDMNMYKTTVRQLESLIRLSEAMARLECSSIVEESHVKEAVRLLT